jgi:hypothetical protein
MKYFLTQTESSLCPGCSQPTRMLATEHVSDAPAFYLCFCGYIGQIGVGPVEEYTEPKEDEDVVRRSIPDWVITLVKLARRLDANAFLEVPPEIRTLIEKEAP